MVLRGRRHHHRLADETAEQGYRRDREPADHIKAKGDRHALVHPAEVGQLALAGGVHHRTGPHEQQGLVQDVREGVGRGAVEGERRPQSDSAHHVPDLADDVVGQQPPGIVLQHRVDNPVDRHHRTEVDQNLCAGERPDEHVHRGLGGKGGHENRPGDRRLGVGVGEPGAEGGHRGVEDETDEDAVERRSSAERHHRVECDRPRLREVDADSGEQTQTPGDVDEQIPETGARGLFRPLRPDQNHGRKGQHFPKQEEGEEIAGKGDAEGGPCVNERRHVLAVVPDVEGVHKTDHGHDRKDIREDEAEVVIPGCTIVSTMLTSQKVFEIDEVPIIDPVYAGIKMAEVLVDLKKTYGIGVCRASIYAAAAGWEKEKPIKF